MVYYGGNKLFLTTTNPHKEYYMKNLLLVMLVSGAIIQASDDMKVSLYARKKDLGSAQSFLDRKGIPYTTTAIGEANVIYGANPYNAAQDLATNRQAYVILHSASVTNWFRTQRTINQIDDLLRPAKITEGNKAKIVALWNEQAINDDNINIVKPQNEIAYKNALLVAHAFNAIGATVLDEDQLKDNLETFLSYGLERTSAEEIQPALDEYNKPYVITEYTHSGLNFVNNHKGKIALACTTPIVAVGGIYAWTQVDQSTKSSVRR